MRDVYGCMGCSNCVVISTAGFIKYDTYKCSIFNIDVDEDDGCTFGDDAGVQPGVIPYDIDLSMTSAYMPTYDIE